MSEQGGLENGAEVCAVKRMPVKIAVALCKIRTEIKNPKKDKSVEFSFKNKKTDKWEVKDFPYASLDAILDGSNPICAKNGLAIMQEPVPEYIVDYSADGKPETTVAVKLETSLVHESGDVYECRPFKMIAENTTPQKIASIITYARRYQLSALLGITSEEDDDGGSGMHQAPPTVQAVRTCTQKEQELLLALGKAYGFTPSIIASVLKKDYNAKLTELTIEQFMAASTRMYAKHVADSKTAEKPNEEPKPDIKDEGKQVGLNDI